MTFRSLCQEIPAVTSVIFYLSSKRLRPEPQQSPQPSKLNYFFSSLIALHFRRFSARNRTASGG